MNIGILGAAKIAPHVMIKPAKQLEQVTVLAIAARDSVKAHRFAKKHNISRVHESYDALLADADIDLVYVPLPNGYHAQWAIKALEAGKHVLCEKPLASNEQEARLMAETAEKHGKKLLCAFHYRHHPLIDYVKQQIKVIGPIEHIDVSFCSPLLLFGYSPKDFRLQYGLGGGAMMDLGCYCINAIQHLSDQTLTVDSAQAHAFSKMIDRGMTANFVFGEGQTARMICSFQRFNPLRMLDIRLSIRGAHGSIKVINPFLPQIFHSITTSTQAGRIKKRFKASSTFYYQLKAVSEYIRDGKDFPVSSEESIENMRLIDSVYTHAGMKVRGHSGVGSE